MRKVDQHRGGADSNRVQGWNNPQGDTYFKTQRQQADHASEHTANYFYQLMKKIGHELHDVTGAFATTVPLSEQPDILDMCMAPGGFLATALDLNPDARALAYSLPPSDGGHKVLLPPRPNISTKFIDITMLATDMGAHDIPAGHVDSGKFLPRHFDPTRRFDLILCDGQVLRTHAPTRASYREKREARRLSTVQLALSLEHIRPGGTIVILLHKIEAWRSLKTIYTFSKFSSVRLYKPRAGHATRSSFYMVANSVRSERPEALAAVEEWKEAWRSATFDADEEYVELLRKGEQGVAEVLAEFGPELVRLGREVWDVQAKALAKAPYIKNN